MQQVILNVFTEIIASILFRLPNYTFQIVYSALKTTKWTREKNENVQL